MNSLASIRPHIHIAHYYRFNGRPGEDNRYGYYYAYHLFNRGRGQIQWEDRTEPVAKGSLLYVPPGIQHSIISDEKSPLEAYNIYCEMWGLKATTHESLVFQQKDFNPQQMAEIRDCPELSAKPGVLDLKHDPYLMETFVRMARMHNQEEDERYRLAANAMLYAWLIDISEYEPEQNEEDFRILRVIRQMEERPDLTEPLEIWLTRAGMKKSRFYELFHRITGLAPKMYLLKIKMQRAAVMLTESKRRISSIAEELGYPSVHYFTRQFTAFYGISPSRYRQGL